MLNTTATTATTGTKGAGQPTSGRGADPHNLANRTPDGRALHQHAGLTSDEIRDKQTAKLQAIVITAIFGLAVLDGAAPQTLIAIGALLGVCLFDYKF